MPASIDFLHDPVIDSHPQPGTFAAAGPMSQNRTGHTATPLPDGRVLVAGGYPFGQLNIPLSSAEIFDPSQRTFSPTGSMNAPRHGNYAALLPSGVGGATYLPNELTFSYGGDTLR